MFARLVLHHRQRLGLTQEDLAARTGLSVRTVRAMEAGEVRTPRPASVRLLAEAFGLSPADAELFRRSATGLGEAAGTDDTGSDPDAVYGAAPTGRDAPSAPVPRLLPRDLRDFVGRHAERSALVRAAAEHRVVSISTVDGMAGVGKTTLAVHVAHELSAGYPDGQLFVDLSGHTAGHDPVDPSAALDTLLRQIGLSGSRIPAGLDDRIELWRAEAAGRRLLVVLDNAADAAQVEPLLPGTGGSFVVVTSRRRLTGIDGVQTVSLDAMTVPEAVALLSAVVGDGRVAAEPEAAAEVVRLCGRLPLAVRIAGARLRHRPAWTVASLTRRLGDERARLRELDEAHRGVASAFALSYRRLDPGQRWAFQLLGLHVGTDLDAHQLAAMGAVPVETAHRLLQDLVDVHMLNEPAPDRYRLHDLLRDYAGTVAGELPPAEATLARDRLLDYLLHVTVRAELLIDHKALPWPVRCAHPPAAVPDLSDGAAALAWLDRHEATLRAAIRFAAGSDRPVLAWKLPYLLSRYWDMRHRQADAIPVCEVALAAVAALDDPLPTADLHYVLARLTFRTGRLRDTLALAREAVVGYRRAGHDPGLCDALNGTGLAHEAMGDYPAAREAFSAALELADKLAGGAPTQQLCAALNNMAIVCGRLGDLTGAIGYLVTARRAAQALGDEHTVATHLSNLGFAHMKLDRLDEAERYLLDALAIYHRAGDEPRQIDMLSQLGVVLSLRGRHAEALAHHDEAIAVMGRTAMHERTPAIHNNRGESQRAAGHRAASRESHERALAVAEAAGDRYEAARALASLGTLLHDWPGEADQAARYLSRAREIYRELGVPEADQVPDPPG